MFFTPWFDKHFIQEKDNKILRLRLEKGSIRIFSFHLFLSVDNIAMLEDNIQARDQSANKLYLIISTLIVYKDHDGLYDGVSFYPNIELILTRRWSCLYFDGQLYSWEKFDKLFNIRNVLNIFKSMENYWKSSQKSAYWLNFKICSEIIFQIAITHFQAIFKLFSLCTGIT